MKRHRAFLILMAFASVLFLSDIWRYREFVRAESYFALGSRLMIERNEWLAPHAPDERQLNKPPLTFWLIGVCYKLFGANFGSARLPSVLAALGVLAIVYLLGRSFYGERAGLISAGVLASSYLFYTFARTAMSDMLLTFFLTASFACFITALTSAASRLALWGYVSLALAVLTKGPIALLLVAAPIGLALLWSRDSDGLKRLRVATGTALFLILAAPYFSLVYLRLGPEPLRFFFVAENLQRFTGGLYGSSARPFWFQVLAFFSDFAPWSLLIFLAGWVDWRARIRDDSTRLARRIIYLWLVSTIVLFSLSSFKLDYYLLPAMPAAALLIGPTIANIERLPTLTQNGLKAFLILVAVFMVAVSLVSLRVAAVLSVTSVVRFFPAVVALSGLAAVLFYFRHRIVLAAITLMLMIWSTVIAMQAALLPAFTHYLPAGPLVSNLPSQRVLYTSGAATGWANSLAFNLPPPHRVERLIGDTNNDRLFAVLKDDMRAVAVILDYEYADLSAKDSQIQVIAKAESYGHAGLTLKLLRNPKRDRLFLVGYVR